MKNQLAITAFATAAFALSPACGTKKDKNTNSQSPVQEQMSEEEANSIGHPKYIVVRTPVNGGSGEDAVMFQTDKDPAQAKTEEEVAEFEASLMEESTSVEVLSDDEATSTESYFYNYHWGHKGKSCYGGSYSGCNPVYTKGNYLTSYGYNGGACDSSYCYGRYAPYNSRKYYPEQVTYSSNTNYYKKTHIHDEKNVYVDRKVTNYYDKYVNEYEDNYYKHYDKTYKKNDYPSTYSSYKYPSYNKSGYGYGSYSNKGYYGGNSNYQRASYGGNYGGSSYGGGY